MSILNTANFFRPGEFLVQALHYFLNIYANVKFLFFLLFIGIEDTKDLFENKNFIKNYQSAK